MAQYYTETEETEEQLLDFDRAMLDFRAMFPSIDSQQIELVLRKHDGDVSASINELLFDNNAASSNANVFRQQREDVLTKLRRRRHEINEKLRENQELLDRVTDVDSARTYEDQQLAYLLEHQEVSQLIREEKSKQILSPPQKKNSELAEKKRNEKHTPSSSSSSAFRRRSVTLEERVPDGPYVGSSEGASGGGDWAARLKGTFKKASGSRISRLFSSP